MSVPLEAQPRNQQQGCFLIISIAVILMSIAYCSKTPEQPAAIASSNNIEAAATPQQVVTYPALQPLSKAATRTGLAHFKLATAAEGALGAMIYSLNCYDALEHQFTWAKLDKCGAFDAAAAHALADDASVTQEQQSYFEPETAAERFLAAATKAGEPASDADTRLALLQKRASAALKPVAPPPSDVEEVVGNIADPSTNAETPDQTSDSED